MTTLQHQHKYMVGKEVLVNGHVYKVDDHRCITEVHPPDADKLLLSSVWRKMPNGKVEPVAPSVVVVASRPPPAQQPPEPPAPVPEAEPEVIEAAATPEYVDPPVPPEGGEWPDPDERMSLDYLRLMAEAYEVAPKRNLKKATLIGRIQKAMYDE